MILVSACLLGQNVKYSGGNNYCKLLNDPFYKDYFLPVCPEVLGGLPTPRPPAEIFLQPSDKSFKRKVINAENDDVTNYFLKGAQSTLDLVQKYKIKYAILKANSPSCGSGKIYDGTFSKQLVSGNGITVELLLANGVIVYNEKELTANLLKTIINSLKN